MKRKPLLTSLQITAIILLFIVALNAIAAGYGFITDPSGKGLGITTHYLRKSAPFKNYLVSGIFLFLLNGILSIIIAILSIRKYKYYPVLISFKGAF